MKELLEISKSVQLDFIPTQKYSVRFQVQFYKLAIKAQSIVLQKVFPRNNRALSTFKIINQFL